MPVLHSALIGSHLHYPMGHSASTVPLDLAVHATAYRITDISSNNLFVIDTASDIQSITFGNVVADPDFNVLTDSYLRQSSRWHVFNYTQTLGATDGGIVHHRTNTIAKALFWDESADAFVVAELHNGASGTGDSLSAPSGSTQTLTDAAATFTSSYVGRRLTLAGATGPTNNGVFIITAAPSGTTLEFTNANGVVEASFTGTWAISGDPGHATNAVVDTYSDFEAQHVRLTGTLRLAERGADPAPVANTGYVYTKDLAGVTTLYFENDAGTTFNLLAGMVADHGLLTGLLDDDHTQYALLAGRAGGQFFNGGTAASENLVLESTAHATKGIISLLSTLSAGSGVVFAASLSPVALSGTTNDYNPAGLGTTSVVYLDPGGANRDLTGIVPATPSDGRILIVVHGGTANTIRLMDQSASSAAANRFALAGGANMTLTAGAAAILIYQAGAVNRWRAI